jgi:hypothetical protein
MALLTNAGTFTNLSTLGQMDLFDQSAHPSVIDFQKMHDIPTWGGYRYWAATTTMEGVSDPEAVGDGEPENPFLIVSVSDPVNGWSNTILRVIDDASDVGKIQPQDPGYGDWTETRQAADPVLVYDSVNDVIRAFWIRETRPDSGDYPRLTTRTINSNFTMGPISEVGGNETFDQIASPAIIYDENGGLHMWYAHEIGEPLWSGQFYYSFSNDNGLSWTNGVACTNDVFKEYGAAKTLWHCSCNLLRSTDQVHIFACISEGIDWTDMPSVAFKTSFTDPLTIIALGPEVNLVPSPTPAWDDNFIYQSSFIPSRVENDLHYEVWYTGATQSIGAGIQPKWCARVGYTQGTVISNYFGTTSATVDIRGRVIITPSATPTSIEKSCDGGLTWVTVSDEQLTDNGDGTWTDHRPQKNYRSTTTMSGTLNFLEYILFCQTWGTDPAVWNPLKPTSIIIDSINKNIPAIPARFQGTKHLSSPQPYYGENLTLGAHTYSVSGATNPRFYYSDFTADFGAEIRYRCNIVGVYEEVAISPRPDRVAVVHEMASRAKTLFLEYSDVSTGSVGFSSDASLGSDLFNAVMLYNVTGDIEWLPIIAACFSNDNEVIKDNVVADKELWEIGRLIYYLWASYRFMIATPGFNSSAYTGLALDILELAAKHVNLIRTNWTYHSYNQYLPSMRRTSEYQVGAFNHYGVAGYAIAVVMNEPSVAQTAYPDEYDNATLANVVDALTDRMLWDDRWRGWNNVRGQSPWLVPYAHGLDLPWYSAGVQYNWEANWRVRWNNGSEIAVYKIHTDPPTTGYPPSNTSYWTKDDVPYGGAVYNYSGIYERFEEEGLYEYDQATTGVLDESYADFMWPFVDYLVRVKGYGTQDHTEHYNLITQWNVIRGMKEPYWFYCHFYGGCSPLDLVVKANTYWRTQGLTESNAEFNNLIDLLYSAAMVSDGSKLSVHGTDMAEEVEYLPVGHKTDPPMTVFDPYNTLFGYHYMFIDSDISSTEWVAFTYKPVTDNNKPAGTYDVNAETIIIIASSGSEVTDIEYQWGGTDTPISVGSTTANIQMQEGTLNWRGVWSSGQDTGYEDWQSRTYIAALMFGANSDNNFESGDLIDLFRVINTSVSCSSGIDSKIALFKYIVSLISPASGSGGHRSSVTVSWGFHPDASKYQIQVSRDSEFSDIFLNDFTENTTYTINNVEDYSQFYWRVRPII